jgi:predicted DCC family thiol-disulfide oxidoreductase YuxK
MAILLYDGDCAICTSSARWLQRHAISAASVTPWQFVDLEALGLTQSQCQEAIQWRSGESGSSGADAFADYLLTSTSGWRRIGALLSLRPVRPIAHVVYRWVARNRDRLPGGTPACAVPPTTKRG